MTPPGPKPMPTNLRLLRGDTLRGKGRPLSQNEPHPLIPDLIPDPPAPLEGYAADEWRRVVVELYRLRLLTVVDINSLAAYCQSYKTWREATEIMTELAARGAPMKALVLKNRKGEVTKNPLNGVARDAAREMVRFASEFGFSPAARARIAAGPYGETRQTDKFSGLIPD
jgi:P27 family predicted phage terminase small subunit